MEQRERENANFRSKYGRLLTFSLGMILIYQLIPDGIETVYFWLLLICYTIGAIITWTDEFKNNLIKALILFLLDGVIISFVIPGLNIGNDIHNLLIIIFITAYFIGSLYAALLSEFMLFLYKSYIRVRMPDSIQYIIDKIIQFTSCLNPFGVLIYLGSSLTFLPRVEGISRPIEMTFSDISDFLVAIKNEISRLLPTEINNSLSQIQHQITTLLIDPLIRYIHLDQIIGLILLIFLLFISIHISVFIENRTQKIKKRCIEICKDYLHISYTHLNLIYNLLLIFFIIYLSIYGVRNYDSFLVYIALLPVIIFFAVRISKYINNNIKILELIIIVRGVRKFLTSIVKKKYSYIFILLDTSESMASNKKIEYAKDEVIKILRNLDGSGNKVGLVTFGGNDLVKIYPLRDNYSELIDIIKGLKAGGSTPILKAIKVANEELENTDLSKIKNKSIYIITDGQPTDSRGIVPQLEDEILEYIKKDIHCEIKIKGIDAICKNNFIKQIERLSKNKAR